MRCENEDVEQIVATERAKGNNLEASGAFPESWKSEPVREWMTNVSAIRQAMKPDFLPGEQLSSLQRSAVQVQA
jgi:hypothetical protein